MIERRGIGQEASGANVGLVTLFSGHSFDEPDPGPVYELTRASADAYASLGDELGVDIEYERCGGVVFALDGRSARGHPPRVRGLSALRRAGRVARRPRRAGVRAGLLLGRHPRRGLLSAERPDQSPHALPCLRRGRPASRRADHLGTTVQNRLRRLAACARCARAPAISRASSSCNAAGAWAAEIGAMVGINACP